MNALDRVRIVLVRTFHPGNIGSAARSMKTMGLSDLCLVAPREFPSEEATKMAAGAQDLLTSVRLADSLPQAIADCTAVIACTARPRGYDLPSLSPGEAAQMLLDGARTDPVAVVFGPERMGLHNDDVQLAKYRLTIPANPAYSSLNLAAAVQILSYEIFKQSLSTANSGPRSARELPTSMEVERLHAHLESVLKQIEFLRPHQGETLLRTRHLLNRAEPSTAEINILRGILSSIEKSLEGKSKKS